MAELSADLHATLKSMMKVIESGRAASERGESLTDLLHRIDRLGEEMAGDCPPMLQHYLEKRSYTKAIDFLEGRDETAKPNC